MQAGYIGATISNWTMRPSNLPIIRSRWSYLQRRDHRRGDVYSEVQLPLSQGSGEPSPWPRSSRKLEPVPRSRSSLIARLSYEPQERARRCIAAINPLATSSFFSGVGIPLLYPRTPSYGWADGLEIVREILARSSFCGFHARMLHAPTQKASSD